MLCFYKFFTEGLPYQPEKHNLILKIFSLSQQPSKSQTFKFLEFLWVTLPFKPPAQLHRQTLQKPSPNTTKP
jgi:hypothetical protein